MLGIQKAKKELNWYPRLSLEETIKMTVDWYKLFFTNAEMEKLSRQQIDFFSHK